MEADYGGKTTEFVFHRVPTNVWAKVLGTPQTTGPQLLHLKRVINLIFQDSNVEKVLRLHDSPGSWDTLYRIFEVIEGNVGRLVVDLKWMSKAQKKLYSDSSKPAGNW